MPPAAATQRQYYSRSGIALPRIDLRKPAARRFRDLINSFEKELGGGELSAAEQALVVTAATIVVRQEALRDAVVRGEAINDTDLKGLASEGRRVLELLRTKSKGNPASGADALTSYLTENYGAATVEAGGDA
jgi:hypothetical protein